MVEPAAHDASLRRIWYDAAPATAAQESCADAGPGVAVSTGVPIAGQVVLFRLDASPARPQAILCRSKAAKIAAACGVPFARLPSSSSTARSLENHDVAAQPSELGSVQL